MNECRENNVGSLGKDTSFPAAKGLSNEEEPSDNAEGEWSPPVSRLLDECLEPHSQ